MSISSRFESSFDPLFSNPHYVTGQKRDRDEEEELEEGEIPPQEFLGAIPDRLHSDFSSHVNRQLRAGILPDKLRGKMNTLFGSVFQKFRVEREAASTLFNKTFSVENVPLGEDPRWDLIGLNRFYQPIKHQGRLGSRFIIDNISESLDLEPSRTAEDKNGLRYLQHNLRRFHNADGLQPLTREDKYQRHNLARYQLFYFLMVAYHKLGITNISQGKTQYNSQQGKYDPITGQGTEAAHHSLLPTVNDNMCWDLARTIDGKLEEVRTRVRNPRESVESVQIEKIYDVMKLLVALGISAKEAQSYINDYLVNDLKPNCQRLPGMIRQCGGQSLINEQTPFFYHHNSTFVEDSILNRADDQLEPELRKLALGSLQRASSDCEMKPWGLYCEFVKDSEKVFDEVLQQNKSRRLEIIQGVNSLKGCIENIRDQQHILSNVNPNSNPIVKIASLRKFLQLLKVYDGHLKALQESCRDYENQFNSSKKNASIENRLQPSTTFYKRLISWDRNPAMQRLEIMENEVVGEEEQNKFLSKVKLLSESLLLRAKETYGERCVLAFAECKKPALEQEIVDEFIKTRLGEEYSETHLRKVLEFWGVPADSSMTTESQAAKAIRRILASKEEGKVSRIVADRYSDRRDLNCAVIFKTQQAQIVVLREIAENFNTLPDDPYESIKNNLGQLRQETYENYKNLILCLGVQKKVLHSCSTQESLITGMVSGKMSPEEMGKALWDQQLFLIRRAVNP